MTERLKTKKATQTDTQANAMGLPQLLRVLVLGSGGREHALAVKIAKSPLCKEVIVAPGNDGMVFAPFIGNSKQISIHPMQAPGSIAEMVAVCKKLKPDLVVVGPDNLLADGVVDELESVGFLVFGPRKNAAKLEWSKVFSKTVLNELNLPTARHEVIVSDDANELKEAVDNVGGYPAVLKYDGLALGKGVRICESEVEALDFLRTVFKENKFKHTSIKTEVKTDQTQTSKVIAESFLRGHEMSLFAICDATDYVVLEPVCDHKQLYDGGKGPNTGGMGAFSPVPWMPQDRLKEIAQSIFPKVLNYMNSSKHPFKGLLYVGLMVSENDFWVLEFNVRFGDPETQCLLPRLESDLLPILYLSAKNQLKNAFKPLQATSKTNPHDFEKTLQWSQLGAVTVVAASEGYPEKPVTGLPITFDPNLKPNFSDTHIYFSGVKNLEGSLQTNGGRVFSITVTADAIDEASVVALEKLEKIHFDKIHYRKDIGRLEPEF